MRITPGKMILLLALYLLLITVVFGAQSYLIHFKYIPEILAPFKDHRELHRYLDGALSKVADASTFWFLLAFGHIVGQGVATYLARRKREGEAGY